MICANVNFYTNIWTLIYSVFLLGSSSSAGQLSRGELGSYEEAAQIYSTIIRKYDSRVRPPSNHSIPVIVSADLRLKFIYSFNIQEQILHSLISLNLSWSDHRLAWYPNNILKVIVDQDLIWVPQISFVNGLSLPQEIGKGSIHLISKGNVSWYRQLSVKTFCPTDLSNRTNTCLLSLGSTSYQNNEQQLQLENFTIGHFKQNNHLWHVTRNDDRSGVDKNKGIIRCAVDLRPLHTNLPAFSMLRASSPAVAFSKFYKLIICSLLVGFFHYDFFF